jgi:choline dehydrogenase-like flavoprotein
VITFHHPLGTCKMGRLNDPDAVVDPEPGCWVSTHCGSSTLRSCRTWSAATFKAPVIMVAGKAADVIRGCEPLAPVNV